MRTLYETPTPAGEIYSLEEEHGTYSVMCAPSGDMLAPRQVMDIPSYVLIGMAEAIRQRQETIQGMLPLQMASDAEHQAMLRQLSIRFDV